MDEADLPEPDRLEGAPHPRETVRLFGHRAAQAEVLRAHAAGRMHHAWLISGQQGIGKATLAWAIARFLLTRPDAEGGLFAPPPPDSLEVPADHPVAVRMRALSEPRLFLLRRGMNATESGLSAETRVDEVRRLRNFLGLTAADGGWRVVIVDSLDELNTQAANAILKLLEEPPPRVTFLMVAHQPFRILPTIRSRCRELRLGPLDPADLSDALVQAGASVQPEDRAALAELAGGSVGAAFRLTNLDGLRLYATLVDLLTGLPRIDRPKALALAEAGGARGAEARFALIVTQVDLILARMALAGTTGAVPPEAAPGEAALLARVSPDPQRARVWADLAQTLGIRARRARAVNLDPAALLMDMVLRIDETAGSLALR